MEIKVNFFNGSHQYRDSIQMDIPVDELDTHVESILMEDYLGSTQEAQEKAFWATVSTESDDTWVEYTRVKLNVSKEIKFIHRMLQEKNIPIETNLLEAEGHIGLTLGMLLGFINGCKESHRATIQNMFSKIDFHNGDLMHYIGFLAKGMTEALNLSLS